MQMLTTAVTTFSTNPSCQEPQPHKKSISAGKVAAGQGESKSSRQKSRERELRSRTKNKGKRHPAMSWVWGMQGQNRQMWLVVDTRDKCLRAGGEHTLNLKVTKLT